MTAALYQVRFEGTQAQTLALEETLENHLLSTCLFEKEGTNGEIWIFEGITDQEISLQTLESWVCDDLKSILFLVEIAPLPSLNWLAENRKAFPPIEVGRFFIHHSDEEKLPAPGYISLEINASTAFGTGQHGTTKGCLLLLERLKDQGVMPNRLLDLGCGTAVLAMASARLFENTQILACDNDEEAVKMSMENILKNGLEKKIHTFLSDGFESHDPYAPFSAPFDVIVANILADPLIHMAGDIVHHLHQEGWLILSGLLITQQNKVLKAYEDLGLSLRDVVHQDEWSTMLLKKKNRRAS